jgi:hypothetical protein
MGASVVVVVQPDRQLAAPVGGGAVGHGIGPVLEHGLDEALGLAVGLGRVGPGPQVAQAERLAGLAEEMAAVAGAVVGHDPAHADAVAGEPDHCPSEEARAAVAGLVVQDLDIGEPGMVVDADVDKLPADAIVLAAPGPGDAMAGLVEAGELLDVEMDQIAGSGALVTAHRLLGRKRGQAVQAEAHELGGDGRAGQVKAACDFLAGHPALAQAHDQGLPALGDPRRHMARPRRAIEQPERPFGAVSGEPFANRAHAHTGGLGRLGRAPAQLAHPLHHEGSTVGRGARILVTVHPGGSPVPAGFAHRSLRPPARVNNLLGKQI